MVNIVFTNKLGKWQFYAALPDRLLDGIQRHLKDSGAEIHIERVKEFNISEVKAIEAKLNA